MSYMSKVSALTRPARELFAAMLFIALVVLASGCGGGSTSSSFANDPPVVVPPVVNPPVVPPPVTGIATPTSVAVVTATNAQ
jgi:predicted component of type VI protein secretion system